MLTLSTSRRTVNEKNAMPAIGHRSHGNAAGTRYKHLLNVEIQYVPNEKFKSLPTEQSPKGVMQRNDVSNNKLKHEEEAELFQQMNFLKYSAENIQRKSKRPNKQQLYDIHQLLNEANDIRNFIVQNNMRLVYSIARKYARNENDFADLVSEGSTALIQAAEKFDYSRGFRFSTYATHAIRNSIIRAINPAKKDQWISSSDVIDNLISEPDSPSEDESGQDGIRATIEHYLAQLNPRERSILMHRFGLLNDGPSMTLQALGHQWGISKERVRQIEKQALHKLRKYALEIS